MLRGHVDVINPAFVSGWALDSAHLDDPVDVCVFVQGHKLAQVPCDLLRPGLRGKPGFGEGRHAFRIDLGPPLSTSVPTRVTVRHATTGRILGNGDAILNGDRHDRPSDLLADLPPGFFHIAAPRTPRQTFSSLLLYDDRQGLYNLLRQMDFDQSSPEQTACAVLGECSSETRSLIESHVDSPRDLMNELLLSQEFRENILRLLLDAFPEKRRLLFVHIPKCAGSDLGLHLASRYANISERLRTPHWINDSQMFEGLSKAVRELHFSDAIFVSGHINLSDYMNQQLPRPSDHLFTILRDPVDIGISQVNYVLTRLRTDAGRGQFQPDTQGWLELLGLQALPDDLSETYLVRLGMESLHNRMLVMANAMCSWLGGGSAATVVKRLAELRVEVTNTQNYSQWRRQRWGIQTNTRTNESTKFLTRDNIGHENIDYLRERSPEDAKLYQDIARRLSQSGACSVTDWAE